MFVKSRSASSFSIRAGNWSPFASNAVNVNNILSRLRVRPTCSIFTGTPRFRSSMPKNGPLMNSSLDRVGKCDVQDRFPPSLVSACKNGTTVIRTRRRRQSEITVKIPRMAPTQAINNVISSRLIVNVGLAMIMFQLSIIELREQRTRKLLHFRRL